MEEQPKKMGRPKGYPKTGGRQAGTLNKTTQRRLKKQQTYVKALERIDEQSTASLIRLLQSETNEDEKKKIQTVLWLRGELRWMLRPVQLKMYYAIKAAIKRGNSLKYVINSSRRLGKSFILCVIAIEYAIQNGEYPVLFAAPTQKALKKILRPLFRQIIKTAPSKVRPVFKTQEDVYRFPSGAEIQIGGCNNGHEDDLRGTAAGLCLIDEAGMIDDLEYVVEDVLMPQLLTTGGHLIMASTPPKTPAHSFVTYAHLAEINGNYSEYTIEDSGYDKEIIEKFISEAGGRESTTCLREYFCEFVVDQESALVPEWKDEFTKDVPRSNVFQFFHLYEAMDVGGRDKNATLFGYYDFTNARLVVEDEVVITGSEMTSRVIARTIKEKERQLWPERFFDQVEKCISPENWKPAEVYLRIADNNNVILLNDLGKDFNLYFKPTDKDQLLAMVNQVRVWVKAGRILVHPRCQQLSGCLKFGIWNKNRDKFERSAAYGHFDALAALVYMVRNIDVYTNPIPQTLNKSESTHFIQGTEEISQDGRELLKIFGVRR